ncbi:UNKNOWN [Stylonychia lemnae]|uniref:DUF7932 domain-containing protein n=1 Tax=Stylonychia lemnae TaxID=5949 RepID=A0A077ZPR5_STYLE|nr:UNKNOWN [Stylonychia lemnae]|eukprot:CDW71365.1 UNKNOWN [Stylonychia lemnae]
MAEIKLSGVDGQDGEDGYAGSHYGENGTNAGPAQDGGDGGQAYLRIQRVLESQSAILVSGTIHSQPFNQVFELGPNGFLNIDARGGKGGRGGYGGNGHDGRPGHDGMDATRFTNGTNGGSGGNGGNGGNGSSGGHGGKGGFVQIIVAESDMDLLLLLGPIKIKGGPGGELGRNGHGGCGGRGGRGGSSYTYSTTTTSTYRDSNGNTQTQYHTHWHTNPGGIDGPPGNSGHNGNAQLYCGRDGNDGQFEFIVEHGAGPVKYEDKYDLKIVDFGMIFYEEDGIIEPGEKAYISTLTIHNLGLMPTPIHTDFFISLVDNNWLSGIGSLQIPRAIAPMDLITIPFKHEFLINYPLMPQTSPKPREEITTAQVQIFKPSINRFLPPSIVVQPKPLLISYPLSLSQYQCLRTFSPGQEAKILITLKNNSTLEIGGEIRPAQLWLQSGDGEFDTTDILVSYKGEKKPLKDPYVIKIPMIDPMSTIVIQCQITIPQVGYLLKATYNVSSYLTDPRNQAATFPCIHTFPYQIRTGFHYVPFPEQDFVFVINENTKIEEVNYIQEMCLYYGLKANFYDINMNGNLNLFEPLPHLTTTLAQDLDNKTLVIINNQFTVSSTSQDIVYARTLDFLRKSEVLRAIAEHHVHFVIFSPYQHNYNAWTFKYDPECHVFNDENEFLAQEYGFSERPFSDKVGSSCAIHAKKAFISFKSKIDQLNIQADEMRQTVSKRFPNHSYLACTLFREGQPLKRIGQVVIMRTPPMLGQYVTFMDFNDIRSKPMDFAFALLNTVDIDKKAKIAVRVLQNIEKKNPFELAMQESLAFTLSREIYIGCNSKHSRKFNFDDFSCFLSVLKNQKKDADYFNPKAMEELFLRLKKCTSKEARFADKLIFWVAHAKLLRQMNKKLGQLMQLMHNDKQNKLEQEATIKTISADYLIKKKKYKGLNFPKYLLLSNLDLDGTTYRSWLNTKTVISEKELKEFQANEKKHNEQCNILVDYKKQLDDQLKV